MSVIRERLSEKKQQRIADSFAVPRRATLEPPRLSKEGREELGFEQRSCIQKLQFRSRAHVVKWIKAHPPNAYFAKVYPYKCPRCEFWHTTALPQREAR